MDMSQPDVLPVQPFVEPLTAREQEVLVHLAASHSNREIADALVVSLNTVKWYNRQIYGKLGVNSRRQAVTRARELGLLPAIHPQAKAQSIQGPQTEETPPPVRVPTPAYNLPASPTPFFGRVRELAALEAMLGNAATRLVTLTGPGGSGKTRLALEAGARVAEQDRQALADGSPGGGPPLAFPHGAVFVPLAAVPSAEGLLPALADALQVRLKGGQKQLLDALRRRQVLLILDNLEHLLAGIELLAEILRAAPGVQILATSREQLQLRGEHVLAVGGLDYPDHEASRRLPDAAGIEPYLAAYPAFQLFLESARRVQPGLALAPEDLPVMLEICRRLDGLPLALELAASWADTLSLDEILVETRQSLGFLQAEWRDAPERQRSMRAVFDVSWRRLTEAEQAAFSQLSVFRGGFTREAAAQAVMGIEAAPRLLAALVRKSFLQHDQASHRYQIHELLRQYGAEKLANDPAAESAARDRHSRYYCDWLGQAGEGLKDRAPQAVWDAIQADIENVRAACLWAASHGHPNRLAPAVNTLGWFYYLGYGNYQQGEATFHRLRETLPETGTGLSPDAANAACTMVRILAWQATMWSLLGDLETSWRLIHEAQALLDGPVLAGQDTRLERAILAHQSGYGRMYADPAAGRQHFAESLELYEQIGHKLGMAYALMSLGRAAVRLGMADEVRESATRGLSLQQEIGNQSGLSEALMSLGGWTAGQMQFREGEDLIRQGLSLTPQTNPFGTAFGLGFLGQVQLETGRFAEAAATALECMTIFEDIGWRLWSIRRSIILARARLHAGEYAAARAEAEATISAAQEVDWGRGVGYAQVVLAEVALVEAGYAQAYHLLQESLVHLREYANQPWDVHHSTWLGLAARGLERRDEAWRHLASALEGAGKGPRFLELMTVLAGIALLLADEGQIERAIELYALASRYPFVANSCWFEDVAGRQITAAADTLPAERVAILQERGQARDLETTIAELLSELRT
jgi:predicted ATPase/DNA-binding CsgD family transcriptional regulator